MSWTFDNGTILTKAALVGEYDNNAFVVACAQTGRGVIIDAAAEPDRVFELTDGVEVEALLTTHGHYDHLRAVAPVVEALGVPFLLHPADYELAARTTPVAPTALADGEVIPLGETSLLTMHTPGHTPGSVSFLSPGVLFSGDTLFPGGPGATQYEGGDFDTIIKSIKERLLALDDATEVYPGHGPTATTIGKERPDLPEWIARGW
ncbi:MAG: MBL fold metallo-hydrolase [bacterium]|nr:MBL fold metallo-hydrolase [bacterium]MDE0290664.1 MBL fold metallo-hydrolase [bacterium]MDE0439117.1 MBL fold metallo-hydrolase [bacterium]